MHVCVAVLSEVLHLWTLPDVLSVLSVQNIFTLLNTVAFSVTFNAF